ncbi:MAG: hypothetical protein ACJA0S_000498 [Rickettsiales bacterium]|jgi:hypothetical protein
MDLLVARLKSVFYFFIFIFIYLWQLEQLSGLIVLKDMVL